MTKNFNTTTVTPEVVDALAEIAAYRAAIAQYEADVLAYAMIEAEATSRIDAQFALIDELTTPVQYAVECDYTVEAEYDVWYEVEPVVEPAQPGFFARIAASFASLNVSDGITVKSRKH